jgi:hypothetical protein
MADDFLDKIQDLSDLELAALICLVAQEHCIIDTEPDALDDIVQELELVLQNIYSCLLLSSAADFARLLRRPSA